METKEVGLQRDVAGNDDDHRHHRKTRNPTPRKKLRRTRNYRSVPPSNGNA